jgi:pimeloyl-ACP methyl ester carboxylesterase
LKTFGVSVVKKIENNLNVYTIPGLGMDPLLFKYLQLPNCNIIPIAWISPLKKETLPEYALRLSKQIDTSKPFVLIGVSFGGMCAIEISKKLNPLQTILVSSSKVSAELPGALIGFKYIPLYRLLSDFLYLKFTMLIRKRLGVTADLKTEFKSMLAQPPQHYFSRAIHMILHWKNEIIPPRVLHIHGNADQVVFYKKNVTYDYTIEGGSHYMIVDRAEEISDIIAKELNK